MNKRTDLVTLADINQVKDDFAKRWVTLHSVVRVRTKILYWNPHKDKYKIEIYEHIDVKVYHCRSLGEAITAYNLVNAKE